MWERVERPLKAALYSADDSRDQVKQSLSSYALTFIILVLLSFIMLWLGDKLNASGMVVTRFMASVQTPVTSQFKYPEEARDQITVVMYDDEFLRTNNSAWPISYQDHADWLIRLAGDPHARPKAVFLDITFGQNRKDPTTPALKKAFCTLQNEFKVPVFLAALPAPETGQLQVRPGLGGDHAAGESSCFTLVGVDYIPDPLDGIAWSYELSRHLTDTGWESGPPKDPLKQPFYRSAAMSIAQDVAHIDLGEETKPMSLIWGHISAEQSDRPDSLKSCQPGEKDWTKVIPGVLRQVWEGPSKPICPYHRTLSMAQVGEMSEQELKPYLAGRYVMVGANVQGFNDFALSPIHQLLPGIHMHAMALDNFLTYKGSYKLSENWDFPPSTTLLAPGFISITAVFIVHIGWGWARRRLDLSMSPEGTACKQPFQPYHSVWKNVLQNMLRGLAWTLRIIVQSAVAIILITSLQSVFRIGMLPVVELIGMTIVAEGMSYMVRLRKFFYGEAEYERELFNRD